MTVLRPLQAQTTGMNMLENKPKLEASLPGVSFHSKQLFYPRCPVSNMVAKPPASESHRTVRFPGGSQSQLLVSRRELGPSEAV